MAVPESARPGANPSLFSSLRSFWSVLLAILYTRLDLATLELEEEASRAVQLLAVMLAALLSAGMTVFFFLFFLVVYFWDHAALVLAIVFVLGVIVSATLALIARHMVLNRPKFLSQTLAELRRDVDGLRAATKVVEETKP